MLKKFILISAIVFISFIVILENLSRRPCANIYSAPNPCSGLLYKYVFEPTGSVNFTYPEEKDVTYKQIKDPGFEKQMFDDTYFVPVSEVKANGRVCSGYAFIAEELPEKAKRYVTYHENIHLAGVYNETRTNYLAAKIEPVGFVQTVFYSLKPGLTPTSGSGFLCRLGRLWNIFKMYFLNINPN